MSSTTTDDDSCVWIRMLLVIHDPFTGTLPIHPLLGTIQSFAEFRGHLSPINHGAWQYVKPGQVRHPVRRPIEPLLPDGFS